MSQNYGSTDFWVLKLDQVGNIIWEQNYGGSSTDDAETMVLTEDGGFLLGGSSRSVDQDISNNIGFSDYWIIKLSSDGSIEWDKNYGGSGEDFLKWISVADEGGYILGGDSRSDDGDVSGNSGQEDLWVVKITASGEIEWEQTYGGTDEESLRSVQPAKDGGYIICGSTLSNDGDISSNNGIYDYWIIKIDDSGSIEWEQTYGGFDLDIGLALQPSDEGGYIIAGWILSDEADVSENYGDEDLWVIKLNASGNLEWEQNYGGSSPDQGYAMQRTSDAGYIIAGSSSSDDIDVASNNGESDFWLVKLAPCLPDNSVTEDALTLTANAAGLSYQWLDCDDNFSPIPNATSQSYDASAGGTFAVAISEGNCTIISECFFVLGVDTDELNPQIQVDIYPNPASDQLFVEQQDLINYEVQIYNLSGQLMYSESNNQQLSTIDISGFALGAYLVRVTNERGTAVRRVVVK